MRDVDYRFRSMVSLGQAYVSSKTNTVLGLAAMAFRQKFSRLLLVGDGAGWALDEDMRELAKIAARIGIHTLPGKSLGGAHRQSIFFSSLDALIPFSEQSRGCRVAASCFHGRPGQGVPVFDRRFDWLCRWHEKIDRLQVTNTVFRDVVLESKIEPGKLHLIPIGINLDFFSKQTTKSRTDARAHYQLPQSAVIVGSFQKDGNGWGEGMEPKLIKGPDIFLKAVAQLKQKVPELFVLLSGPARGFVKAGLERNGIPYKHILVENYPEIGRLYQCLDLYLVTSREEGGPKAILESMASGIPLVTTSVGQAVDLVSHGKNAWMAEIEDDEGLAYWGWLALNNRTATEVVAANAREFSEVYSYDALTGAWRKFMDGFVNPSKQRA